ncbi:ester cyclase [Kitasatospora purpeofusca]|uniref:ester cyclase n=1 Tax=Kitasatospora purpeofusca TaxID=67352 RepID=UPI002A5AA415|nr:ester cyclase [Kitasatospora purpeofusca]MDY0813188.1 ester cyclase [Kitasatospora purpeofusca]
MTSSTESVVEANKALIRELTERAFNDGDLSAIGDRFAEDYVVHAPGLPPMPPGPDSFRQAVLLWRNAFPDVNVTVEDVAGDGDRVYARFTTRGTHQGRLFDIPPTGKPVTVHEMSCHRIVDGRVVESWIGDNVPRILLDIGAIQPVGRPQH